MRRSGRFSASSRHVQAELAELRRAQHALVVKEWTQSRAPLLANLDARPRIDRIRAHILRPSEDACGRTEPTTHTVIENIFPKDFYDLVNAAIPPAELFPSRDPVKQDSTSTSTSKARPCSRGACGTSLTRTSSREFSRQRCINGFTRRSSIITRRRRAAISAERAAAIPHRGFAGRLHLRRPGYHLKPHLDPKRVVITGLVYFARPGDSEAYGTQLFRVGKPFTSSTMGKFYPEDEGLPVELARTVPFRANTLFAFVNSKAAHGATLPADAPLARAVRVSVLREASRRRSEEAPAGVAA